MAAPFYQRSYTPELLDNEYIPTEDLYQNLRELDIINRRLGGHAVVIQAIQLLLETPSTRTVHVAEIGSGGGDNLRAIATWGRKTNQQFTLTGIDLKPTCTAFATDKSRGFPIRFITSDYREADFSNTAKPDIIFNSLFCHHFTDEQLVEMFLWMRDNAAVGFTICDLHRHPLAYHAIKQLTRIFSTSYLVKNDAPLSVLRGFKKSELVTLLERAGIRQYKIRWAWAFRWIVTVKTS